MNSENEPRSLDEFLDDENGRTPAHSSNSAPQQYHAPPGGQPYGYYPYPQAAPPQKKNPAIIALLCGILVVGLAILAIQIFKPFDKNNNDNQFPQKQPGYGQPFQNDPNTYGNYGPGNGGDGPNFHQNPGGGPGMGGGEQRGQYRAPDGMIIQFRSKDGKTEYSTDGGKTWSETPPEGMPPLP